jgi:DNA primase
VNAMNNFLPEDWIEEVRSRNDIVDVVSEYIVLKPSGRGFFALCPFHNEKTASFHVYPEKQIYHCFGCGVGGDVFSFIMSIEGLNFTEAVKYLADRVGISLPETVSPNQAIHSKDTKDTLYDINREAARYYHRQLFSQKGEQALEYLTSRGVDIKTIRRFGLGYAPAGWKNTKDYLLQLGFKEEELVQSGIIIQKNNKSYDRFRNRVMFPIIHPRGTVIAFGGRVLDDSLPKYLNSSDSPVFNKSSVLFGLNLAKKERPLKNIIIVEGYMDVITLHQYGFKNAVASLGTSLTQGQASLIRRYTREVFIAYDGDAAGQRATLRGLDILYRAGLKIRVMEFPKGMDPDEVLKKYGSEYFNKLMNQAVSLIDYKLDHLKNEHDLETVEGRVSYATKAANILITVDNVLERDVHIKRLERLTGFKSELLYQQIDKLLSRNGPKGVKNPSVGNNSHIRRLETQTALLPGYIKAEKGLINLMAQNEDIAKEVFKRLTVEQFQVDINKEVAKIIMELLEKGKEINVAAVLSYVKDKEKMEQIAEIFAREMEYDNINKYVQDCIEEIEIYNLQDRRRKLQKQIADMDQHGIADLDEYRSIIQELEDLNYRLKM